MTQPQKTRRQVLEDFLAANPNDAFARYGLAMECASVGDTASAVEHYSKLIASHPDYLPGYQMFGQLLASLERKDEARKVFSAGIVVARKAGNLHAVSEMESAVQDLDR